MERTSRPAFQDIGARLIQLGVELAERIVDRGRTEHSHSLAFPLLYLEPLCLDNHAEVLYEEDAAKDRQQQLLVDDDGADTDDTADGQRTCVSHEDLCGEGIIPEESDHGSHESAEEDYQFLGVGDIHDVEVGSIANV